MCCADRNIDRFPCSHRDLLVVESDFRSAFNYEPVLCALRVFLITESLTRQDLDPLHFETAIFLEHCVTSPRPAIKLPHTHSSLIGMVEYNRTERGSAGPSHPIVTDDLTRRYRARFWLPGATALGSVRSSLSTSGRSRFCVA